MARTCAQPKFTHLCAFCENWTGDSADVSHPQQRSRCPSSRQVIRRRLRISPCLEPKIRNTPFGDPAIAAMGIVAKVSMFSGSAVIGFGQGFQPVCGFNYGARLYGRVREAFWSCVKAGTAALRCQPVSDLCAFLIALPIAIGSLRRMCGQDTAANQ